MNYILKFDQILIDPQRCCIERGGEVYSVEPKVMDVLTFLIEHRGQVCSQEAIFSAVWPKGIYSQSSVQRCIALARKAIGDSAQNPQYICTHQRRGYSFECKSTFEMSELKSNKSKEKSLLYWRSLCGFALIFTLALSGYLFLSKTIEVDIYKSHPLTSSTEVEFYGVYSPDGNWIAYIKDELPPEEHSQEEPFQEELRRTLSSIWLMDRRSNQHQILHASSSDILTLSWSPDSQGVYFSERDTIGYHIGIMPLNTDLEVTRLISIELPKQVWRPVAVNQNGDGLSSDDIFFIESSLPLNKQSRTELKYLNRKTGDVHSLLVSSAQFTPYRLAHCFDDERQVHQLAIAGEAENSMVAVRFFDLNDWQLGAELATFPLGFTEIRCNDKNNKLLVLHNNQLYWLGFDGSKTLIEWDNYHTIYNPDIAPHSGKLLITEAQEDVDLAIYSLANHSTVRTFDNKVNDSTARISSDGVVAVNSSRSGPVKTFLQSEHSTLLFDNPGSLPLLSAPLWSIEEEQLLIHQSGIAHIFSQDGSKIASYPMMTEVIRVHDWSQTENIILVSARLGHEDWFGLLDLKSQHFEKILLTGSNASARLMANGDVLVVQGPSIIAVNRQNEKSVLLELESDIQHAPIPIKGGFLIQIKNQVFRFNKGDVRGANVATLPKNYEHLVDANRSGELLLLATAIRFDMELLQLERLDIR